MNVRIATVHDVPDITRLIQKLAEHDGATPPVTERLQETLRTLLNRDATTYLVAEDEMGRVIGSMQLDFRLTTWEAAPYVYIEDFFVEPEHRGQRVGTAMLELAKDISRQRGCVRMDLDVLNESVAAQSFYFRHGFVDQKRLYLRLTL
jgi:ribosomal protein S18 acetylase RimI-like enzyme